MQRQRAGCVFCEIVSGARPAAIVASDDAAVAFLDARPVFKGHVLVVPARARRRRSPTCRPAPLGPYFAAVQRLARAVEVGLGADGTFVAMNNKVSQSVAAPAHARRPAPPQGRPARLLLAARPLRQRRRARRLRGPDPRGGSEVQRARAPRGRGRGPQPAALGRGQDDPRRADRPARRAPVPPGNAKASRRSAARGSREIRRIGKNLLLTLAGARAGARRRLVAPGDDREVAAPRGEGTGAARHARRARSRGRHAPLLRRPPDVRPVPRRPRRALRRAARDRGARSRSAGRRDRRHRARRPPRAAPDADQGGAARSDAAGGRGEHPGQRVAVSRRDRSAAAGALALGRGGPAPRRRHLAVDRLHAEDASPPRVPTGAPPTSATSRSAPAPNPFLVYGRAGARCPRRSEAASEAAKKVASTIVRIVQAGRATFYCPRCQT